ncbi:Mad3/BUB1 homology region 1-domain-containing protein [Cerioporus squamosus]|nr:Mad3/BUB1 homology region 1-domain-containing protein [Cerioporus squamosus]
MADVFTDDPDSPPIVDCDVLEAAKENIQPLASGRRVTALSAILSTPHAQRESRLADARKRHRANVQIAMEDEAEDADPLEVYSRFVYWTVENYPQGHSAESGIVELLEEATRVLRDYREGKWRQDIRYLKLWVMYASYVDKPTIIYKYLLVNEIGTNHALLYEEYAIALERANRRVEADETYLLGIARKATPLERLEARHREFQKRMMASPPLPSSNSSDPTTENVIPSSAAAAAPAPRRQVLGEPPASSSSRTRSSRSGSTRSPPVSEDVFSAPAPSRPNGRMPIFVDPSGDVENDPEAAANPSPWPELGTRKTRIKENTMEVSKAAGTTLRNAGRSKRTASSSSKIAVFRDPGPSQDVASEEMPPPPVPPAKKEKSRSVSKSSMSIFCDEDAEAGPSTAPESAPKTKGRSASKSSVAIFRDDDEQADAPEPAVKKGKARTTSKTSIPIFRDEEEQAASPAVPSTPRFVPFRDDELPTTSSSSTTQGTVIRPKPAVKPVMMSAEAEALRKDPFKNYNEEEKPVDD